MYCRVNGYLLKCVVEYFVSLFRILEFKNTEFYFEFQNYILIFAHKISHHAYNKTKDAD